MSTASIANIPVPTPPVASGPHLIHIPSVSNAHTSSVRLVSQTQSTPRISTPISHPLVSAATPYSTSLPHPTISNTMLSLPVTYEQFLCGELPTPTSQLHPSHAPSSLHTPQPRTRYTIPPVSPDSNPSATCFRLSPPSFHTRLTYFATNEPYLPPPRISNIIVSSEKSKGSSRRSSRSTVRIRSSSLETSRNYDMFSMSSGFPKTLQFEAFTSSSRKRPRRFTYHSLPEERFPQRVVASSKGPT